MLVYCIGILSVLVFLRVVFGLLRSPLVWLLVALGLFAGRDSCRCHHPHGHHGWY